MNIPVGDVGVRFFFAKDRAGYMRSAITKKRRDLL